LTAGASICGIGILETPKPSVMTLMREMTGAAFWFW